MKEVKRLVIGFRSFYDTDIVFEKIASTLIWGRTDRLQEAKTNVSDAHAVIVHKEGFRNITSGGNVVNLWGCISRHMRVILRGRDGVVISWLRRQETIKML